MERRISVLRIAIGWLFAIKTSSAAPAIAFPINAQLPPVARVGQLFQFTFSASTFSPPSDSIQYSLQDPPSWVQLDAASLTFKGTPGQADTGSKTFELSASDDTGLTSMPITLVVSSDPGPAVGKPVTEQLQSSQSFSPPDALLFYPSSPISVSFGPDTFTNTNHNTVYYATCANNTPLPPWLDFDPQSLSFSGRTPAFNSPLQLPQDFGIRLVASDVPGYAAAETNFRLVIGSHELTFGNDTLSMNVIPGNAVTYSGLKALAVDGNPAKAGDVQLSSNDMPSWLSIDQASFIISGTAPAVLQDSAFLVTASDLTNNSASTTIHIQADKDGDLAINSMGPLYAMAGHHFAYHVNRSDIIGNNIKTSMNLGICSSWLTYDPISLSLTGQVPSNLGGEHTELVFAASTGPESQVQNITLFIASNNGASSTSPTHTSSSVNPLPTTQTSDEPSNDSGERLKIAAAVLIPTLVLAALLLLVLCLRRRRRRSGTQKRRLSDVAGPCLICIRKLKKDKHWISRPVLSQDIHEPWHDNEKLLRPIEREYAPAPHIPDIPSSTRPPTASRPSRAGNSQRPFSPLHPRSSFQEGFFKEIRKRFSWAANPTWLKPDFSPKPSRFSIAEEKPPSRSHRDSGSRPSTRGKLSAIHSARALRQRKNAHRSKSLTAPRHPSGLGHGRIYPLASRSSAAILGAPRNSTSYPGLGHGRAFPARTSASPPWGLPSSRPSWHHPSLLSRDPSGPSLWASTSASTLSTSTGSTRLHLTRTASSHPPNGNTADPSPAHRHRISTIRAVTPTPESSPPPVPPRRRAPLYPYPQRPLSRDRTISRILRARRECDSAYFASSVSEGRRRVRRWGPPESPKLPDLPVASLFAKTPEGGVGKGGEAAGGAGSASLRASTSGFGGGKAPSPKRRVTPAWKGEGLLSAQPSASSLYSQSVSGSRRLPSLRGREQRRRGYARGWEHPIGLPSSSLQSSSGGQKRELARFTSMSSMGAETERGSEGTEEGVGLGLRLGDGIELVEEGDLGGRERRWAEGKRKSGLVGERIFGESIRKEEKQDVSAVLRDGRGRRPVSVIELDGSGGERPKKSLKGSYEKAFL